jgi:hypothetical protein
MGARGKDTLGRGAIYIHTYHIGSMMCGKLSILFGKVCRRVSAMNMPPHAPHAPILSARGLTGRYCILKLVDSSSWSIKKPDASICAATIMLGTVPFPLVHPLPGVLLIFFKAQASIV